MARSEAHGGTQGENRYSYVLNNPLKYADPSGETPFSLFGALTVGEPVAAATEALPTVTVTATRIGTGVPSLAATQIAVPDASPQLSPALEEVANSTPAIKSSAIGGVAAAPVWLGTGIYTAIAITVQTIQALQESSNVANTSNNIAINGAAAQNSSNYAVPVSNSVSPTFQQTADLRGRSEEHLGGLTVIILNNPGIKVDKNVVRQKIIDYLNVLYDGQFSGRLNAPNISVVSEKEVDLMYVKAGYIAVVGKAAKVKTYYKTILNGYSPGYNSDNLSDLNDATTGDISGIMRKGIGISGPGVLNVFKGLPKNYTNEVKLALTVLHGLGHNLTPNKPIDARVGGGQSGGHTDDYSKNFMMNGDALNTWILNGAANIKYGPYDGSIKSAEDLFNPENNQDLIPAFQNGFYNPVINLSKILKF